MLQVRRSDSGHSKVSLCSSVSVHWAQIKCHHFSGNLRQKKLHSVYLVFLDTDIAEPENACRRTCQDYVGKEFIQKSSSNLGIHQVLRNETGSSRGKFFSRHGSCILGFRMTQPLCQRWNSNCMSKDAVSNSESATFIVCLHAAAASSWIQACSLRPLVAASLSSMEEAMATV